MRRGDEREEDMRKKNRKVSRKETKGRIDGRGISEADQSDVDERRIVRK
jgi:hypothetical protein